MWKEFAEQILKKIAEIAQPIIEFLQIILYFGIVIIIAITVLILIKKPFEELLIMILQINTKEPKQRQKKSKYEKHIEKKWWKKFRP